MFIFLNLIIEYNHILQHLRYKIKQVHKIYLQHNKPSLSSSLHSAWLRSLQTHENVCITVSKIVKHKYFDDQALTFIIEFP